MSKKQDEEPLIQEPTPDVQEQPAVEPAPKPSKRDQLNGLLSEELGEGYDPTDDEGSAEMLSKYITNNRDQRQRLAEALRQDPRLAQVLADIVTGKRGAAGAMARYFGKDFLSAEEGTPEYDEIMRAEEERKEQAQAIANSEQQYQTNLEQSLPTVEQWCKQHDYEVDDFLTRAYDSIIRPILQGMYSTQVLDLLDKGLNYDRDTKDAMKAGEIRGRNTNIAKLRENRGDGMPKGISSTIPNDNRKRSKRGGGILGSALSIQEDYT